MLKLLVADSSQIFTHSLSQMLSDSYRLQICDDGDTALALLQSFQPDVLIINLMLPRTDGLSVLQQTTFRPKIIMAMTNYVSGYVEQTMTDLGVDYTMVTPSLNALRLRLEDLVRKQIVVSDPRDLHALTVGYLHALNVPTHLDGYRQLCLALPMYAKDPQQLLTKELYPAIAQVCGCKDGRAVEHSIRKAIQTAWRKRNSNVWRKYFPVGPRGTVPCPTNKEFICCLAEYLMR